MPEEGWMTRKQFDEALQDVSKHFSAPADILASADLTRSQKLALLKQWEYDLQLLLVATEENMTGTGGAGANAEKIQQIHAAVAQLGAESDPEKRGPAKAGSVH